MNKVLLYTLLTGGLYLVAMKIGSAAQTVNIAKRLSVAVSAFRFNGNKGLDSKALVTLTIQNPTGKPLTIESPFVDITYNEKPLGNSIATSKAIKLEPNKPTRVPIQLELPFSKYIIAMPDIATQLTALANGKKLNRKIKINLYGKANGNSLPGDRLFSFDWII
jgi:hypothetical protein